MSRDRSRTVTLGRKPMSNKRRRLIPMFPTLEDVERAMRAMEEAEARRKRALERKQEPTRSCGWCDEMAERDLGEVAGEVF
jgi:hypothetical protein